MEDEREMEQEKQRSNSLRQARLKVWFPVTCRKKKNLWSFYMCTLHLEGGTVSLGLMQLTPD